MWTRKAELQVRAAYGLEVDAAAQAGPVQCVIAMVQKQHGTAATKIFMRGGWVSIVKNMKQQISPISKPETARNRSRCKHRRKQLPEVRASETAPEKPEQSLNAAEAPSEKEALPSQTATLESSKSSKSSGARTGYGDQNGCSEGGRVLNMW